MSTQWLKNYLCLLAQSFFSNNTRGIANRWLIRMHRFIAFISLRLFVIAEHSRAHTTGDARRHAGARKQQISYVFIFYIIHTNGNSTTMLSLSPPEPEINRKRKNKILFVYGHKRSFFCTCTLYLCLVRKLQAHSWY